MAHGCGNSLSKQGDDPSRSMGGMAVFGKPGHQTLGGQAFARPPKLLSIVVGVFRQATVSSTRRLGAVARVDPVALRGRPWLRKPVAERPQGGGVVRASPSQQQTERKIDYIPTSNTPQANFTFLSSMPKTLLKIGATTAWAWK
ncbi:hypothetical protein [Mesorhizobium neociceri]|uniref:Uncharacterized protein n=1 Tax=Mesorhizobium neociceri TaxID=1307853 RepID=A0A838B8J7_9HYPH|nr:hypothetical protein [Mesorhizobium neociceri]MBA1142503.1 hypothetical protein [Mesorhizobium neociceri]